MRSLAGFETWLSSVNRELVRRCGMGVEDLPDAPYRDLYEDCLGPRTAAAVVLRRLTRDS